MSSEHNHDGGQANQDTVQSLQQLSPDTLSQSRAHVRRTEAEPDDQLIASIDSIGIVNVLIGRFEDGEVRLVDGVRRAKAAVELGMDSVPVLVRNLTDSEAKIQSMKLNRESGTAENKTVAESDREKAIGELAQKKMSTPEEVKADIGLLHEADLIERELEHVPGVGTVTATRLADRWTLEELEDPDTHNSLTSVPGIGEQTASAIRRHFRD